MDLNEELRLKRLNYYNKLIINSSTPNISVKMDEKISKNASITKKSTSLTNTQIENYIETDKIPEHQNQQENTNNTNIQPLKEPSIIRRFSSTSDESSMKVLEKIFGTNNENQKLDTNNSPSLIPKIRKFSQSISFDDNNDLPYSQQGSAVSSNRKLEEFKRIIESSYQQHVQTNNLLKQISLNEDKYLKNSSRNIPSSTLNQNQTDLSILNSFMAESHAIDLNTFHFNDELNMSQSTSVNTTAATVPYKLQYMSAYNFYDTNSASNLKNEENLNVLKDKKNSIDIVLNNYEQSKNLKEADTKLHVNKKLSSNGSSLNTSPTSVSSVESLKKLNVDFDQISTTSNSTLNASKNQNNISEIKSTKVKNEVTAYEIKPPETPRTRAANLNYRKNLIKTNNQSANHLDDIITLNDQKSKLDKDGARKVNSLTMNNSLNFDNQPKSNILENLQDYKVEKIDKKLEETKLTENVNESLIDKIFNNNTISKPIIAQSETKNINDKLDLFFNMPEPTFSNKNKLDENNKNQASSKIFKSRDIDDEENEDQSYRSNSSNNERNDDTIGSDILEEFSSQESLNDINKNIVNDNLNSVDLTNSKKVPEKSQLELKNKVKDSLFNSSIKKMDLRLDLDQLSDNEGADDKDIEDQNKIKNIKGYEDTSDENEYYKNSITVSSRAASAHQQIKPDHIPNLALDLIDDDKSQSVAASLAKPIDYHKEMETIYKQKILTLPPTKNPKLKKPAASKTSTNQIEYSTMPPSTKSQNLNRILGTSSSSQKPQQAPISSLSLTTNSGNSSIKPNDNNKFKLINSTINQETGETTSSYFLKAPLSSSRQNSSRRIDPIKITSRPSSPSLNSLNNNHNNKFKNEDINLVRSNLNKTSNPKKPIDLRKSTNVSNSIENLYEIDKSLLKKAKDILKTNTNSQNTTAREAPNRIDRKQHWQTSMSVSLARKKRTASAVLVKKSPSPSSSVNQVIQPNTLINRNLNEKNLTTSSGLFLNYSKLIEIESNFNKDLQFLSDTENRPKTASPFLENNNKNNKTRIEPLSNDILSTNNKEFDENSNILSNNISEKNDLNLSLEDSASEIIKKLLALQTSSKPNEEKNDIFANWLCLPDEIWLKILFYLNQADLVHFGQTCKTFNKLYLDDSLWRNITIKYKYEMCDEWLHWIGRRRPNELNIIQCSGNVTLYAISEMFRNIGTNLTTLNLSRCSNGSLSGDNFALQASIRCPNVTNLDLSWTLLSNQTLKLISDSFKKIESINLSGCNMIQEDGFNILLQKHGESIKNLEISGCIHFSTNSIYNIGVYCRNIEKLNISNCHRVTNESLIEAAPHWLKLKYIDLRGIKSIKNNCISALVRKCSHLEALILGDCVHISDASTLEISTYKPNIKYLDFNGCKKITDNSLRSIANFCSKLEFLNLKGTNVTDTGLISLSNGKCMKEIEDLNLSFLPISEVVLMKLLKKAEKMKRIHLYGCYNIKRINDIKNSIGENLKNILTINI